MKAASRIFFLFAAALALCGFSSKFNIKVIQQDHNVPSFELSKNTMLRMSDGVEINTFLVVQKNKSGQWDYRNPAWSFALVPGSAKILSTVTYGQVPDGFTEKAKASGLISGAHYLAVGLSPGSGGSAEFVAQ